MLPLTAWNFIFTDLKKKISLSLVYTFSRSKDFLLRSHLWTPTQGLLPNRDVMLRTLQKSKTQGTPCFSTGNCPQGIWLLLSWWNGSHKRRMKQPRLSYSATWLKTQLLQRPGASQSSPAQWGMGFVLYKQIFKKFRLKHGP